MVESRGENPSCKRQVVHPIYIPLSACSSRSLRYCWTNHSRPRQNKRLSLASYTIAESFSRSTQGRLEDAMLCIFASPEVPHKLFSSTRFQRVLSVLNPNCVISSLRTLDSRLWQKFRDTISRIQEVCTESEFTTLAFDGWTSCRNEAVLGFMIAYLGSWWQMATKCVGNFEMTGGHSAADVSHVIEEVILKRLARKVPTYFLSDSATVNTLAVWLCLGEKGDGYWFPCVVHFCQLAMKESIRTFLSLHENIPIDDDADDDYDYSTSNLRTQWISPTFSRGTFSRTPSTCRSIKTAIKRVHQYSNLFEECQRQIDVNVGIKGDVVTRFDSTLIMLDSVLRNKNVLQRMQDVGKKNGKKCPSQFHLSADDLRLIGNIFTILQPVQNVTKNSSSSQSWIGEVLPLIASTIEQVREMEFTSDARPLQLSLLEALTDWMRMLLNIETELSHTGIYRLQNTVPSEFSIAAYLNPKFLMAMSKCFGYSRKAIVTELNRIYEDRFGSETTNANSGRDVRDENIHRGTPKS